MNKSQEQVINNKLVKDNLLNLYNKMLFVNLVEEKIAKEYNKNEIKTPVHLGVGQEAIAVGVCGLLKATDYVFSTHRSHCHYLAKGGNFQNFIDELYGKESGCSGSRGGSMHLIDKEAGFMGSTAIVGGSIPLATGSALKQKVMKTNNITVCFFGDGAAEEGVFHECLNFAAYKKLPIIYVCENNKFAVFTPEHKRKNIENIYQWGEKFGISGKRIDGNDIFEVIDVMKNVSDKVRNGDGPYLIEAMTYLKYGHVGNKIALGYKNLEEYEYFMSHSPINNFYNKLKDLNFISDDENNKIIETLNKKIDDSFNLSRLKKDVLSLELYKNVYVD